MTACCAAVQLRCAALLIGCVAEAAPVAVHMTGASSMVTAIVTVNVVVIADAPAVLGVKLHPGMVKSATMGYVRSGMVIEAAAMLQTVHQVHAQQKVGEKEPRACR